MMFIILTGSNDMWFVPTSPRCKFHALRCIVIHLFLYVSYLQKQAQLTAPPWLLRWQCRLLRQTDATHAEQWTDVWLLVRLQWCHMLIQEMGRLSCEDDRQMSMYVRWVRWLLTDPLRERALSCWATVTLVIVHSCNILLVNLKEVYLTRSTMMVASLAYNIIIDSPIPLVLHILSLVYW